jgi:hypothetical protein
LFAIPTVTRTAAARLAPMAGALSLFAAANAQYVSHDSNVPSPSYTSADQTQFENGQVISFFEVFFDTRLPPGPPQSPPIDSFFDITYKVKSPPGPPNTGTGKMHLHIQRDQQKESFFDIFIGEMIFNGLPAVQLRESPTLQSISHMAIGPIQDTNNFIVASFFDIFTELSLDGGQTWSPALGVTHMVGAPVPEPAALVGPAWKRWQDPAAVRLNGAQR